MCIEISLATTFCLKLNFISSFWIKLTQKGYFQTKKKKKNYHRIIHIQINLDSKFQLQQFLFLEQISKKSILLIEIRKK